MSREMRWLLGIVMILFCAFCLYQSETGAVASVWGMRGFAVFLGVGALACLAPTGRARVVAGRVVSGVVCLTYVVYVVAMAKQGKLATSGPGDSSLPQAVAGLLVIGVPTGWFAVTGRFPRIGYGGALSKAFTPGEGPEEPR